jgi:signal peptidase I
VTPRSRSAKSAAGSIAELIGLLLVVGGLAFAIQAFIVKPYTIPSGSMEPTLEVGQHVLVDRIGNSLSGPHVGEVAVFHPPTEPEEQLCGPHPHEVRSGGAACSQPIPREDTSVNFIKRIVAGPGDVIYVKKGHVYRNGVREKDAYIRACGSDPECDFPKPIKIPPGHWFMMGDNRGESDDSRFWGPVPTAWIIGDAFITYWPPDRIGFL